MNACKPSKYTLFFFPRKETPSIKNIRIIDISEKDALETISMYPQEPSRSDIWGDFYSHPDVDSYAVKLVVKENNEKQTTC